MKNRRASMSGFLSLLLILSASCSLGITASAAPSHHLRYCGNLRAHYRDHGTRQYVQTSHIRTRGLHCGYARRVARRWAQHSRLSGRPAHHVAGARCRYRRTGSDIGVGYCRRGREHRLSFDAYDSSPFH